MNKKKRLVVETLQPAMELEIVDSVNETADEEAVTLIVDVNDKAGASDSVD